MIRVLNKTSSSSVNAFIWSLSLLCVLLVLYSCSQPYRIPDRTPFAADTSSYIVTSGDTLYSIALRANTTTTQLARLNSLKQPYTLHPGQKLIIKKPLNHSNAWSRKKKYIAQKNIFFSDKQSVKHNRHQKFSNSSKKNLKNLFRWPIHGTVVRNFIQSGSKGIDIAGKLGDTIRAAASGTVVYSGPGLLGYGNLIIIKHDPHYLTAYANNRRLFVLEGQTVNQGQKIAEVGVITGQKPSLHFEIRRDGKPVNPGLYLQ